VATPVSDRLRFGQDVWDTVLCWDEDGGMIRTRILDPYRPMPEIIEGETGQHLNECCACGSLREGVRDTLVEFEGERQLVPVGVCAACRTKFERP
jgi:hypothetical protein